MRSFGYAGGVTPAARLDGPGTVVFHGMRTARAARLRLRHPGRAGPMPWSYRTTR